MVHAIKGMNDIRPGAAQGFLESAVWERIFSVSREVLGGYGYRRVWLPCVEETSLFTRGIGEDTDIVSKEMYSFEDRGGRQLTLRPEGTAGAARAYIEHNLAQDQPIQRWWYAGPMFRAERPQKGRYRQFYQIGAELFGVPDAAADAEMLLMLKRWCDRLGLSDIQVRINTLGDQPSRAAFRRELREFLLSRRDGLCESCSQRIDSNPLRVLDCKRPACRTVASEAPDIMKVLTVPAARHFDQVQAMLNARGLAYERDRHLVRGLDYYTGTIFELTTGALGAQDAVLGGGRYDDLVGVLGGSATPAIGFAAGVERLALLLATQDAGQAVPHLYVIALEGCVVAGFALADAVRDAGPWRVEVDVSSARIKQRMRRAHRLGARTTLVIGEDEIRSRTGKLKDLARSAEVGVDLEGTALSAALANICGQGARVCTE